MINGLMVKADVDCLKKHHRNPGDAAKGDTYAHDDIELTHTLFFLIKNVLFHCVL